MAQQHNAQMEESILSANGFGNLEASARDAVRQVMDAAGIDDLSDVQNAIRTGAMRVSFHSSFCFRVFRFATGGPSPLCSGWATYG